MPKIVAIIPSRLESSRVSRKPLANILGAPMIAHVYHRTCLSSLVDEVWVATDSQEVVDAVESYGGKAILTSTDHRNGTERIAEANQTIDGDFVLLVNGDEALLNPEYLHTSYNALVESGADASILINRFYKNGSTSDFKVIVNLANEVMYISRGDVPSDARNSVDHRMKAYHIMAFSKGFLQIYARLERTPMESIEDHEHLRIIENGYRLIAAEVNSSAVSVDTADDLEYARNCMLSDPFFPQYAKYLNG